MNDLRKTGIDLRASLDGDGYVVDLMGSFCYVGPDGGLVDARDRSMDYLYPTKEDAEEALTLYLLKQGASPVT